MLRDEAEAYIQNKFGEYAYAFDRDANTTLKRPAALQRYYVGIGHALYGNGDTWEAAIEAMERMAKATKEMDGRSIEDITF